MSELMYMLATHSTDYMILREMKRGKLNYALNPTVRIKSISPTSTYLSSNPCKLPQLPLPLNIILPTKPCKYTIISRAKSET